MDTPSLERLGITRQLVHKYVESGWLEPVVRGLYRRPGSPGAFDDWRVVVRSAQSVMQYDSTVGGRTALEEQNFAHYVAFRERGKVHLYGDGHPTWLKRLPGDNVYELHRTKLFEPATEELTSVQAPGGLLRCSAPERAIFELLDELPRPESFHLADTFFEALVSLRPSVLTRLLDRCTSVKVKRLFFVFADRHQHAWRQHLSAADFDLGSGARSLVKGGAFSAKYEITVPKELLQKSPGVSPDDA